MSTPFTLTVGDRSYSGRSNLETVDRGDGAPLIVALHGGTYSSEYFDIPGYSLLDRATGQGIPVIALDRPNYVDSDPLESEDSIILANAGVLVDAIGTIWEQYGDGAPGIVLVAHSIGGAVATAIAAAQPSWPLLGLATSGCFAHIPQESRAAWESLPPIPMIDLPTPMKDQVMFGPAGTYAEGMPAASHPSNTLVPKAELLDITGGWIERRAEISGRVTVPVHHRQAEFDALWITNDDELQEFRAGFTTSPSVDAEILPGTGHCIDFHLPAEEFQLGELAFARECAKAAVA
jgi:pimeloyl-ACP methyl ester carboxylesterase